MTASLQKQDSNLGPCFVSMQINPSPDCVRALTKMTGCPACQGLPELKACSNYCINVMKGCLAYQAELDADWNNFVGEAVITRLDSDAFQNVAYASL
jgi:hypothetical protein